MCELLLSLGLALDVAKADHTGFLQFLEAPPHVFTGEQ
jgi:hypothetical protein